MARRYHTLLIRWPEHPELGWCIEFGDYDRNTVLDEQISYADSGHKRRDLKIVTTGHGQAAINAAVAKLNA